jgi:hypothetical protein
MKTKIKVIGEKKITSAKATIDKYTMAGCGRAIVSLHVFYGRGKNRKRYSLSMLDIPDAITFVECK